MRRFFFLFLICCLLSLRSFCQVISNPGQPDSLYPGTDVYYEYVEQGRFLDQFLNPTYGVVRANNKYLLLGNYTNAAQQSGMGVIMDTTNNAILNSTYWRVRGYINCSLPDGLGGFFIGGKFTTIGDTTRTYIAQINKYGVPTGWKAQLNGAVNSIIKRNDTLFIGGEFTTVNGSGRNYFAMYSATGNTLFSAGATAAFSSLGKINCLYLNKDTILAGGLYASSSAKGIKKFSFKTGTTLSWNMQYTDYTEVKHIEMSSDGSVILYSGYYNGEYIRGAGNLYGQLLYTINASLMSFYSSNSGAVWGLKVADNKAYAVGAFSDLINGSTVSRKGFFAFNPLTGSILPDNLNLDGYATYVDQQNDKLYLSGEFTVVNGVSRNHFAQMDTGTYVVRALQLSPSDPITSMSFSGNAVYIAGYLTGTQAVKRNGFVAIDSATHAITPWSPPAPLSSTNELRRLEVKGDTLLILGNLNTRWDACYTYPNTSFRAVSISTGATIGTGMPIYPTDFHVEGNYAYVWDASSLKRYAFPNLAWDLSWGYDWGQLFGQTYQHSMNRLFISGNKIIAVGDSRFKSCISSSYPSRGYVEIYDLATGHLLNAYSYQGANGTGTVLFTKAELCANRLYIQGTFTQVNDSLRRNFVSIDINTGAVTGWNVQFPPVSPTWGFDWVSNLKAYKDKIYFGSYSQVMNDGNYFSGFGAIDTLTGVLTQPITFRQDYQQPYYATYNVAVMDFIISDNELALAGEFSGANGKQVRNLAVFPLTGTNVVQSCPLGSSTLSSNLSGASYQWQMDSGGGFIDISDNANFTGTATHDLQLTNIPASWYNYKFRCNLAGNYSDAFSIRFRDTWTGAVSTAWENPGNWSCGIVPDANTDVIINSGTVVVNADAAVRTISLGTVNFTLMPGVVFTVMH